jgi:hypothetical protein
MNEIWALIQETQRSAYPFHHVSTSEKVLSMNQKALTEHQKSWGLVVGGLSLQNCKK